MDTLSRDSGSSNSNIVPMVGAIAGGLALILSIVALVKISKTDKIVASHTEEVAKIAVVENEVRSASAKAESDVKNLKDGVQNALNEIGTRIGTMNGQIAKLEEAAKKPAAAGKAGAAKGGTLDANGNYTVRKGDSLKGIAAKFGVSVDAIEAENPGLNPKALKTGQKVKIPKK